jgi:hypothetical protein
MLLNRPLYRTLKGLNSSRCRESVDRAVNQFEHQLHSRFEPPANDARGAPSGNLRTLVAAVGLEPTTYGL